MKMKKVMVAARIWLSCRILDPESRLGLAAPTRNEALNSGADLTHPNP